MRAEYHGKSALETCIKRHYPKQKLFIVGTMAYINAENEYKRHGLYLQISKRLLIPKLLLNVKLELIINDYKLDYSTPLLKKFT